MALFDSGNPIANVELSNTFNTWRIRTNQIITQAAGLSSNNVFSGTLNTFDAIQSNTITGDVIGNVTGDLTGNVIGNLVGDVTGDLTGNVIGNLVGNVVGSLVSANGLPIVAGTTGTLSVGRGGTGSTTLTANSVLLGNGTSAFQSVSPGAVGNLLTSLGGTWQSAPLPNSNVSNLGSVSGSTNLNLSDGVITATLTSNVIFTFTNAPASGIISAVTLIITQNNVGNNFITWPASAKYAGGVIPPATSNSNSVDVWSLFTVDGGSTVIVSLSVKDAKS